MAVEQAPTPTATATATATAEQEAIWRRIRSETQGNGLLEWPSRVFPVDAGASPDLVRLHCVQHKRWQATRLVLKGLATHQKLHFLCIWYKQNLPRDPVGTRIQVSNYLGALRRGGQLDMHNRIKRYR